MRKFLPPLLTSLLLFTACSGPVKETLPLAERRASLPEFEQSVWAPLATADLTPDERTYTEFLYSYLPLPDMAMYPFDYWLGEVRSALKTRSEMGWNVPEREFRHFVLPTRVNNENLDAFRTTWADSLCRRVKGLSMYDAVLEINHWCHEQATYKPSDARTSSPLATVASGIGRCGEESVLGVAALRAVGIPARQVYTPRWAHTDDNHAWVEAWVDGKWYFLGACEPEPKLNMAWFNAPASRAMLMHTRVFGDYHGDEDVIDRSPIHTEINVIANYVPTRRNTVTVVDREGRPVEGATVEFKIYNYAEFYTVATYKTDSKGQASLSTGHGDLLAWASKDGMFGFSKLSDQTLMTPVKGHNKAPRKPITTDEAEKEMAEAEAKEAQADDTSLKQMKPGEAVIVLDFKVGQRFAVDIDIVPPAENPIPAEATDEERAACAARFAQEDSLRLAQHPVPAGKATLDAFYASYADDPVQLGLAENLVRSLTEKDRRDVTLDVLVDAMNHDIRNRDGRPHDDVWSAFIECPRVENEQLRPFRTVIEPDSLPAFQSPLDVWQWTCSHIRLIDDQNPQSLRMAPSAVWQYRVADDLSRRIFFVALCRTYGFEARIDEVTGQTQYLYNGEWRMANNGDLKIENGDLAAQGTPSASQNNSQLSIVNSQLKKNCYLAAKYTPQPYLPNPIYYTHFTLSSLNDGIAHLYNFEEGEDTEAGTLASWETLLKKPYQLDAGYYLLTSGTRLASGAVLAHMEFIALGMSKGNTSSMVSDRLAVVPLTMRQADEEIAVIGHFDADPLLPYTGRGYFLLAILGQRDEPSTHARNLLPTLADELTAWGRPVVTLQPGKATATVSMEGTGQEMALTERVVPEALARELSEGCSTTFDRLPVIVIADSFGRIVYYTHGYNTSLATDIRQALTGLR